MVDFDEGNIIEVLLVEDNLGNVRMTQLAFPEANTTIRLHVTVDGVEAMEFLRHTGAFGTAPRPDIILLDLNPPRMDGSEVLAAIKGDNSLKSIPTVILTTSRADDDITKSYRLHNCFLSKPIQMEPFESLVRSINEIWLTNAKLKASR